AAPGSPGETLGPWPRLFGRAARTRTSLNSSALTCWEYCGRFRNTPTAMPECCGISEYICDYSQALKCACKIGGRGENDWKSRRLCVDWRGSRRCLTREMSLVRSQ